jgi:hypothetical protein
VTLSEALLDEASDFDLDARVGEELVQLAVRKVRKVFGVEAGVN